MGRDSHKHRSRSEAPNRSIADDSGSSSRRQKQHSSKVPSRLSQVTNAADISDVDAQAEILGNFSISSPTEQELPFKLTFDSLGEWVRQGGRMESLDDKTQQRLLNEYLQSEDVKQTKSNYKTGKEVPPAAPLLGEVESDDDGGGASLNEPVQQSRHKDKGKGRAR